MSPLAPAISSRTLEAETERFWSVRGLPPAGGALGPPDGSILRQFEGSFVTQENPSFVAYRAVAADADARYLALVGRRAVGTLRWERTEGDAEEPPEGSLLRRLGVWVGGAGAFPWDQEDRQTRVETIVGRLARHGILVSRDLPFRVCPGCGVPRNPERIIYQEEEGGTYLVRFEVPLDGRTVHALVWIDAPWRLLGTSAILLHPDLPYVLARYRRRGVGELVLTSRSSLERFRAWIPDGDFEVVEEHPGRDFAGRPYLYPLRHEFPIGGALAPPGGTVLAVTDVSDTGTGVVPLVPGHGSTDAVIASTHGVPGWPLITPRGQLDFTLVHKYAGLDLRSANEFIVRDLEEGGAIFANLRVRRGVPHCMVCGSPLVWIPGRAWCLEPGRLPPEAIALYRRLLPDAPALPRAEVAPWPVSETALSTEPGAVALLECSRCERLDALDGPAACPCGGKMYPVRRRLVLSARAAFSAWARAEPFPPGDSVRIYLGARRRVPALVHHLAGMTGVGARMTDVSLTVLATLPELDLPALVESHGADVVRATLLRTETAEGSTSMFRERCDQERRRHARLRALAEEVLSLCDPSMLSMLAQPVEGFLSELEVEDRALLARWERTRVAAIAAYDRGAAAAVHRRAFRFIETDLADYRQWVQSRLSLGGSPQAKRGALRTLTHVLGNAAALLAPITPFLAESIHRRLTADRSSIFESPLAGANRALLDEALTTAWERWRTVVAAVNEVRRANAVAPDAVLPWVALVVASDESGDLLRGDRRVLERLARVGRIEVGSPREPWKGRQRQVRPVEEEIQRAYPAQASQIVHLLRRMPPRRTGEAAANTELSVVIQGLPRRVLPSMVEYVDTLPEGVVPVAWPLGELYVHLPGGGRRDRPLPPPLSPDAFWVVRHLEHRLRRSGLPPAGSPPVAIVGAVDPLASELRRVAEPLARYLGIAEVRVPEKVAEAPPPHRIIGRTHTGARWWVHVPGLPPPPPRRKRRSARPATGRVPHGTPAKEAAEPEVDFADEKVIADEEAMRAFNREIDNLLSTPLIGPAKVREAWELGLRSVESLRSTPFETLVAAPGFGWAVTEALYEGAGLPVPPPSPRRARPSSRGAGPPPATGRRRAALPPVVRVAPSPPLPRPEPIPPIAPVSASTASETPLASELREENGAPPPATPTLARAFTNSTEDASLRGDAALAAPAPEATGPEAAPEQPTASEEPPTIGAAIREAPSVPETDTGPVSTPTPVPSVPDERSTGPPALPVPTPPRDEDRIPIVTNPPAEPEVPPASVEGAEGDRAAEPTALPSAPVGIPAPPVPVVAALPLEAAEVVSTPPAVEESAPPESDSGRTFSEVSQPEGPSESATTGPETSSEPSPESPEISGTLLAVEPGGLGPGGPAPTETAARDSSPDARGEESPPAPGEAVSPPLEEVPGSETPGDSPDGVARSGEASSPPSGAALPEAGSLGASGATELSERGPHEPAAGPSASEAVPEPPATESTSLPPPTEASLAAVSEVEPPSSAPPESEAGANELPPGSVAPEPPSAVPEPPSPPAPPPSPPRGGVELIVSPSIVLSLRSFLEATAAGLKGVCIVRESPERVAAQVGSRPADIYWLTNFGRGRTLKPSDLAGIGSFLEAQLTAEHVSVFFIEGIEYLVRLHGVDAVVDRLREFDQRAREHEVRVWVQVTESLLRPGDLEKLLGGFPVAAS